MLTKFNCEFSLSQDQQLEVFARYMANTPNEDLEKLSARRYKEILKEMLYAYGLSILVEPLPEALVLKLGDYRSALRGIASF